MRSRVPFYAQEANAAFAQLKASQGLTSQQAAAMALGYQANLVVHPNPNMAVTVAKRDPRVAELEAELAATRDLHARSCVMRGQLEKELASMSELKSNNAALLKDRDAHMQRANMLADTCGTLRDENTQLLAENARLRRGR